MVQNEQLGFWHTLWMMLLDIYVVLTGPERRAVRIALWLAFFDQVGTHMQRRCTYNVRMVWRGMAALANVVCLVQQFHTCSRKGLANVSSPRHPIEFMHQGSSSQVSNTALQ